MHGYLAKVMLAVGAAGIAVAVACTSQNPVVPAACSAPATYAGPSLRDPLPKSSVTLNSAAQSGLSEAEVTRLAANFDTAFRATKARSMTAAVWQEGGSPWTHREGSDPEQLHYWASVGKILTAAAILRLRADSRLSLDTPISDYVSGVPNGDLITLQMLLNHTSGLFSANEDAQVRKSSTALDLPDLIDVLNRRGSYACPGTYWRYSNSGYTLLGVVLEEVTGKPYHQAATDLVLSRSRAPRIRVLAPDDPLADLAPLATDQFNPAHAQAAGGVVADAGSMAIFLQDLFAGDILPAAQVEEMFHDLYPMADPGLWYGLGVMAYDVPTAEGATLWLGHSGGVEGAKAVAAYVPSRRAIVTVALAGDGSAEAAANLLLSALDD